MNPEIEKVLNTVLVGNWIEVLKGLPNASVQCVVTSPPYWNLRDYGTGQWEGGDAECSHKKDTKHQKQGATSQRAGRANIEAQQNENFRQVCGKCGARRVDEQLGIEATPEEYIAKVVAGFREVRRVLRDDGTLWLNLGDKHHDKNLVGIPWRVAFALQADGWYLRQDIIWAKPNPMPESVTDRCTKSHEYIFLLTKKPRYFYDAEAIKEPSIYPLRDKEGFSGEDAVARKCRGHGNHLGTYASRNLRSVWTIATQPYAEAHFATFPEAIPEKCIKAGTSEKGCCPECGAPWERIVESPKYPKELRALPGDAGVKVGYGHPIVNTTGTGQAMQDWRNSHPARTTGWKPTCTCRAGYGERRADDDPAGTTPDPVPCVVLDPFAGSGTTCAVAHLLGRNYIGIELNPEYAALARDRIDKARDIVLQSQGKRLGKLHKHPGFFDE